MANQRDDEGEAPGSSANASAHANGRPFPGDDKAGARIAAIYERALEEALNRLSSITLDERDDNVAFDRVARTALGFLRIAECAAALHARKRKDESENEENNPAGETERRAERLARDEAELTRRLTDYIDRFAAKSAEASRATPGVADEQSGRGRS